MKRRIVLSVVAGLALVYAGFIGFNVLKYKPLRAKPLPGRQEIEGVYHLHSRFSDGRGEFDAIARTAAEEGLRFVIFTDHGHPNLPSLEAQGWKSGLLALAGSELSVSRGHLVALDFIPPRRPFPQNAEESMRQIRHQGGFGIVAHPYSKVRWNWGGPEVPSGIEIINGDSELRHGYLQSLFWLPALPFNPRLALVKMLGNPRRALSKWDELNARSRVYGYFSADSHLLYRPLFNFLRLHIFLPQPLSADFETARGQVFDALRRGKFYNAVDAARPARGFRFWAARKRRRVPMGGTAEPPIRLRVRVPYRCPKEVRLLRDGQTVASSGRSVLSYLARVPGTYRVEVYLRGRTPLAGDVPWIISNPIFIREEQP
jgi:hypothetical protein